MSDESCVSIEIKKEVPFFGSGDTIESRLRNVTLRGFPDVRIYENAVFETEFLTSNQIPERLHTPQPAVYQTHLDRVSSLATLFREKGIDIFNLDKAYDFEATSESGVVTLWTMLPPIIEKFSIPNRNGMFDYRPIIGDRLKKHLENNDFRMNSVPENTQHTNEMGEYELVNDGMHRIHSGYLKKGVKVLRITGMTPGFPYYAMPQPYAETVVEPTRNQKAIDSKVHILDSPGHKDLYRLFPTGGILSGEVRSEIATK